MFYISSNCWQFKAIVCNSIDNIIVHNTFFSVGKILFILDMAFKPKVASLGLMLLLY